MFLHVTILQGSWHQSFIVVTNQIYNGCIPADSQAQLIQFYSVETAECVFQYQSIPLVSAFSTLLQKLQIWSVVSSE